MIVLFSNRFARCTVLTPLPHNFATSRIEYPLRSGLITSLYSAFICSAVFTEPTLRPRFPPFSIYRFLPDCNRNEILSRSNCAQVESVAIIIGAKRDGCPFSSNNISCSFLYVEVNATVNEFLDRGKHLKRITLQSGQFSDKLDPNAVCFAVFHCLTQHWTLIILLYIR